MKAKRTKTSTGCKREKYRLDTNSNGVVGAYVWWEVRDCLSQNPRALRDILWFDVVRDVDDVSVSVFTEYTFHDTDVLANAKVRQESNHFSRHFYFYFYFCLFNQLLA